MSCDFDVIVVGAGHAGLEAAFICAKFNLKVGLFNLNKQSVANLPCNPSVGGPAKGIVTREIDALGGIQAIAVDATKIQIKKVNFSKGPGVWAYRAQIDRNDYHNWFLSEIEKNPNISLVIEEIIDLIKEGSEIKGIITKNKKYFSKAVIITTGTYLKAELYRDKKFADSGPDNNPSSNFLSQFFINNNIELMRFKTGTSPRVFKDSINFEKLQKDDDNDGKISFSMQSPKALPLEEQYYCYLSETTESTKQFVNKHIDKFGIYNGNIDATGPRYCPSIEDKIIRFPHREKHFIFVEPVAKDCDYYYLSGLSTSLSEDLQEELLQTLTGFENAKIKKHAYAIVYDVVSSFQLKKTLELKTIENLYLAGQINGTSGYEEAAAQGLIAGINASLKILKKEPFILRRDESYIGVLIDDLTSKKIQEPYRLLTSRAEFRLSLRNDNADERLMHYGHQMNLINDEIFNKFQEEQKNIEFNINFLKNNFSSQHGLTDGTVGPLTIFSWLCRQNTSYLKVQEKCKDKLKELSEDGIEKLMIRVKYEGYIRLQKQKIEQLEKWKKLSLLKIQDYGKIHNLSREAIEKLNEIQPITINDALKISGLNINDIFWIKNYIDHQK